jgi:hypothetical protein
VAVKIQVKVFRVVTPHSVVVGYPFKVSENIAASIFMAKYMALGKE